MQFLLGVLEIIMASNEATFRVVAEAEKIFDRVMKAKHPDYAQDVEEAVKLHRARLAAEYAAADHTDIKDYIVPITRMRDYSEARPSVTTEVDSQTLQVWMQLAGIGKEPARKQLSEVIGKVGNKEMLRRMQAVAQSKKDIFSNDQIENIISGLPKTHGCDGWTVPSKPTPPENVRVESVKPCELLYKEHVEVGAFEFSLGAWVMVYVQPFWFPNATIKNVLKTFDGELEYVHSHIAGHWWSGYTITGYFFDKPSAERAATDVRQKACWDGYIEHQRPNPPIGSGGHACRTHSNGDGTKTTYA